MTDEVRKMVDGLETFYEYGNAEDSYQSFEKEWHVRKSDVIELVEKLTKWNSVKDLPTMFQENLLVKSEGKIIFCSYYGTMGFMQHKRNYIRGKAQGSEYQSISNVTEWKPII